MGVKRKAGASERVAVSAHAAQGVMLAPPLQGRRAARLDPGRLSDELRRVAAAAAQKRKADAALDQARREAAAAGASQDALAAVQRVTQATASRQLSKPAPDYDLERAEQALDQYLVDADRDALLGELRVLPRAVVDVALGRCVAAGWQLQDVIEQLPHPSLADRLHGLDPAARLDLVTDTVMAAAAATDEDTSLDLVRRLRRLNGVDDVDETIALVQEAQRILA